MVFAFYFKKFPYISTSPLCPHAVYAVHIIHKCFMQISFNIFTHTNTHTKHNDTIRVTFVCLIYSS